jgi:hypothetical protein
MTRYSVLPIVADHLQTLRHQRTSRPRWSDIAVIYALPVGGGLATLAKEVRLQGIGELIGGLAILAGFLFALVIFVFQLRIAVTNDPRIPRDGLLPRLIDHLFANVSYAVLVGLATAGIAMASAATRSVNKEGDLLPINSWWSSVFVALAAHLFLLLIIALRQVRAAYRELRR